MNAVDVFLDAGAPAAPHARRSGSGRRRHPAKLESVLARRMLLFAAILLLLATFAAAMAPRQPLPPPPPSALPDRAADGDAGTVERRLSVDDGASTAVRVARGDIVRLEVAGDVLDSVELDGLDRIEVIEPVTPAMLRGARRAARDLPDPARGGGSAHRAARDHAVARRRVTPRRRCDAARRGRG